MKIIKVQDIMAPIHRYRHALAPVKVTAGKECLENKIAFV